MELEMNKSFTAAEVREIIGLLTEAETGPVPKADQISTAGAKDLFSAKISDLRHWAIFSEVFAFAYDPDTLDIHAVVRSDDFLGDPSGEILNALNEKHDGGSIEVWGIRHPWAVNPCWGAVPECLESKGRRPANEDDLGRVVQAARDYSEPAAPSPR
jgi:hypothetical protein